jgi:hypothetical protein
MPQRPTCLYTDARHFLDESGNIPDLPGPALALALYLRQIVGWATLHQSTDPDMSVLSCNRRINRRQCRGELFIVLDLETERIEYQCPMCHDMGVISGWKETPWDLSEFAENAKSDPDVQLKENSTDPSLKSPKSSIN